MRARGLRRRALVRAAQLLCTFLGITAVTFALVRLAPGEPALAGEGSPLSPATLVAWRELRGDGSPLWTQYLGWLGRVVTLDFGRSLIDERPVAALLGEALPATALLAAVTLVLSYAAALPLGVHSAVARGRPSGRLVSGLLLVAYTLPPFWVGLGLLSLFAAGEPWTVLPLRGLASPDLAGAGVAARALDVLLHLVMPVTCLGLPLVARTARLLRTSLVEVLGQDFVRAARARGLSERRILWAHAVPSAVVPVAAMLSVDIPYLVGGSVIVERLFTIRGMGMLTFQAMLRRDYPVILGVTVLASLVTMAAMVASDALHLVLDPRARRGAAP